MLVEHVHRPLPKEAGRRTYIGRPSKWGNPFAIGRDGTRAEVIEKYREWVAARPRLVEELRATEPDVLSCWCKPLPCHGDVLAELLERRNEQ